MFVKSAMDDRYDAVDEASDPQIIAHNGKTSPPMSVVKISKFLANAEKHDKFKKADLVLVDEGHFFQDVSWVPDEWVTSK